MVASGNNSNNVKMATTTTTTTSSSSSIKRIIIALPWWWYMFIIPLYGLIRIAMANRMPIMDCDEVYNYWEPLIFLLSSSRDKTVVGQQTWEYAHEYALRTYAYIVPLKIWTNIILQRLLLPLLVQSSSWKFFTDHAVIVGNESSSSSSSSFVALFVLLRASLAAAMAVAELFWLSSLPRLHSSDNKNRALAFVIFTATFLLVAPGMNHAAAAYLPSTTWMMTWLVCSGLFLRLQHYAFCTVAIVATLCIGWPFGVATVVPMAIRILFKEYHNHHNHDTPSSSSSSSSTTSIGRVVRLLGFSAMMTIVIQIAVLVLDYQYYQRWTSATYNIFAYNAAGGGDELYGVEPASYYIKNLLLNLTVTAPLAIPALPLLILTKFLYTTPNNTSTSTRENKKQQQRRLEETNSNWWDLVSILSSLYLWLLILVPRPHKEERFLYPIYPVVCLAAVVTCDTVIQWTATQLLDKRQRRAASSRTAPQVAATAALIVAIRALLIAATVFFIVLPVILLSMARTAALNKYYTAPLHIYATLAAETSTTATPALSTSSSTTARVCTCGEWYRFPSSFFLTGNTNNNNLQLGYLPSSFGGQLPQDFSIHGSGPQSRDVLQPFNDQNKHQPERYVANYQQDCHWIVDLQDESLDEHDDGDGSDSSSSSKSEGKDLCHTLTRGNDASSSFELVASAPFLDASRTVSSLHRVLYIPYFHERAVERRQVSYQRYVLYKKKDAK